MRTSRSSHAWTSSTPKAWLSLSSPSLNSTREFILAGVSASSVYTYMMSLQNCTRHLGCLSAGHLHGKPGRWGMFRAYFRSKPWASRAYGGAAAILVLLLAQLQVALLMNHLNKRFYDVWADPGRHYLAEAYTALLPFLWTGLLLVAISTLATYITAKFVLWWREAVTFHYLTLARGVAVKIEGASQRLQEDIGRFTKVMETIAWSVVGSIFTLIGFVPVMWALSTGVRLPLLSAVPGALVWVCLLT